MSWHFGELSSCKGIHEARLTDTVSPNKTVLLPCSQLYVCVLQQRFSGNQQSDVFKDDIVTFPCSLSLALNHNWRELFGPFFDLFDVLFVGGHRFGIVFHLVFVFFLPLCQFRVAVASSWFFGDEGLPCIFNFELFLKDDNFSQLFCGQFVLVFVLDVVLDGFEVVVEGIAAFEGVGSVDFE